MPSKTRKTATSAAPNKTKAKAPTAKATRTAKKIGHALEIAGGVTAAAAALVDLNRAEPDTLASLKHIGPKRAQKIVEARPFQAVDELAARKLLPKKVVDELRERLSV